MKTMEHTATNSARPSLLASVSTALTKPGPAQPNQLSWLTRTRIRLGGLRQRWATALHERLVQPRIHNCAIPTLTQLRAIKENLPADTPLVGVLLAEHLGDIAASEPVIPYLKSQNPKACLVWLTKPAYASLVDAHPLINAVVPLNSVSEADVVVRSGILDSAWDLHLMGKPCTRFNRNYVKSSGDRSVTTDNYYHFGPLLALLSQSAGLPPLLVPPRLHIPATALRRVDQLDLPKHFIVIHGSSNERVRNWEDSKWPQLVSELHRTYEGKIVEVGLTPVLPADTPGCINLCGKLSPIETAEVIARADLFVGVESGPAHLANAVQTPSVILMGQYKTFGHYMPYTGFLRENERDLLLRSPTLPCDLAVDTVADRTRQILKNSHSSWARAGRKNAPYDPT